MTRLPAPTTTLVHQAGGVALWDFACGAERGQTGEDEATAADLVVLPYRGHFEWRSALTGEAQAGSANTALWCRRGHGYHVTHPVCGGDRCTVLAFGPQHPAGRGGADVRAVPVDARLHLRHRLLRRQLERETGALAKDEALLAFAAAVATSAGGAVPETDVTPTQRRRVRAALELLHAHFDEPLRVHDLARATGGAEHHLARSFRRVVGTSMHRYQLALRTRAALEAVLAGHRELTALALSLGFFDHAHLTRVFTRHFGLPPRAARSSR